MRPSLPALVRCSRLFTLAVVLTVSWAPRPAAAEVVRLVSPNNGLWGDFARVSADGRFLVAVQDPGGVCGTRRFPTYGDVVVYDLETLQAECISVNDAGVADVASLSSPPSISGDGQLVVFSSNTTTLDPRCGGGGLYHVYLRNRLTRHTECLSTTETGTAGNAFSGYARISASGNVIVFSSQATNLVSGKTDVASDLFVVHLVNGIRQGAISRVIRGTMTLGMEAAISADGRFVAVCTDAALISSDTNRQNDVYRHDLQTGETIPVNAVVQGPSSSFTAEQVPAISADGRFVAFFSQNELPGDSSGNIRQLYRRDFATGEVMLVSRGLAGAPANGRAVGERPAADMSADGRFVVFSSTAANLVANDTNAQPDVFVADMSSWTSRITRVGVAADGVTQPYNVRMGRPSISGDATVVSFGSSAINLDPADPRSGIYLARIPTLFTRVLTAPGAGGGPHLRSLGMGGAADPEREFYAYDWNFGGGVSVAQGDVDGDGVPDLVTGMGPGAGPLVRVFSGAGYQVEANGRRSPLELASFSAYDSRFGGGVSVAVGDVTGDGIGDIITGAGPGGGPHVRVFQVRSSSPAGPATIAPYASFFAYQPGFFGGVRVAAGDLDGNGTCEILTAAGPGGGPHVRAFQLDASRNPVPVVSFFAYDPGFSGGVFIAAGDLDRDGREEIITGADAGAGPHVRAFRVGDDFTAVLEVHSFFAYAPWFTGGVRVTAGDLDGDGRAEIITAPGASAAPMVRAFRRSANGGLAELTSFNAYNARFTGGVFVAAPH